MVLPELCITGYTCGDLFLQTPLLDAALDALNKLLEESRCNDLLTLVGIPLRHCGKLYNCAVLFQQGEILGIVPKTNVPNYSEFYEGPAFRICSGEKQHPFSFWGKRYHLVPVCCLLAVS